MGCHPVATRARRQEGWSCATSCRRAVTKAKGSAEGAQLPEPSGEDVVVFRSTLKRGCVPAAVVVGLLAGCAGGQADKADPVGSTTATLNGYWQSTRPAGSIAVLVSFKYGTTTAYGSRAFGYAADGNCLVGWVSSVLGLLRPGSREHDSPVLGPGQRARAEYDLPLQPLRGRRRSDEGRLPERRDIQDRAGRLGLARATSPGLLLAVAAGEVTWEAVVRNRLPRRRGAHPRTHRGPDPRVAVERAHAHADPLRMLVVAPEDRMSRRRRRTTSRPRPRASSPSGRRLPRRRGTTRSRRGRSATLRHRIFAGTDGSGSSSRRGARLATSYRTRRSCSLP